MKKILPTFFLATTFFGLLNAQAQTTNIIVDDKWADATFTNWNLPTQAPWYYNSSSTAFIGADTNKMYLTNYPPTGTKTFWTYFTTNDPALTVNLPSTNVVSNTTNAFYGHPIVLGNGETLLSSLSFIPTGEFLVNGTSGVRFGLLGYDQADAGRATRNTANISKGGTNVTGYRVQIPMYLNWDNNAIIALHVRTNLSTITDSQDPMGKASDWFSLGASPSFTNAPGFVDGGVYRLDFSVTHYADSNVISSTISGPMAGVSDTNFTRTTVDVTGSNFFKFDCYMIRVDTGTLAADLFTCSEFKVVKISPASAVTPFRITSVGMPAANQVALTWDSVSAQQYQVQSKDNLSSVTWSTNATVTATAASTSWTNTGLGAISQRYYRVVATP